VAKPSGIWNCPWQQEARNRKEAAVVELRLVSFYRTGFLEGGPGKKGVLRAASEVGGEGGESDQIASAQTHLAWV